MTEALRKGFAVETMLQADSAGSNSLKRLEAGKARERFERWRGKGYCSKVSQRHGNSLILSRVHGLEIMAYLLAKMSIHILCNILWKIPNDLCGPILFTE